MVSSIAVYKALYKSFGGFAADVVAAIDQVLIKGLLCIQKWHVLGVKRNKIGN